MGRKYKTAKIWEENGHKKEGKPRETMKKKKSEIPKSTRVRNFEEEKIVKTFAKWLSIYTFIYLHITTSRKYGQNIYHIRQNLGSPCWTSENVPHLISFS